MSTTDEPTDDANRFDQNIYQIDIGADIGDFEGTECEPTLHEGRPAKVIAMGPYDEDVRVVTMCTECGQVEEESYYDDAQGITIEGHGTTLSRKTNFPGDTELVKIDYDQSLDDAAAEAGYDEYEVMHAGTNGDELMFVLAAPEEVENA